MSYHQRVLPTTHKAQGSGNLRIFDRRFYQNKSREFFDAYSEYHNTALCYHPEAAFHIRLQCTRSFDAKHRMQFRFHDTALQEQRFFVARRLASFSPFKRKIGPLVYWRMWGQSNKSSGHSKHTIARKSCQQADGGYKAAPGTELSGGVIVLSGCPVTCPFGTVFVAIDAGITDELVVLD